MALQTTIPSLPHRKTTLQTFAVKLMDKIIDAPSPEAIERYIAVAVKALGNQKLNGYIIQRFIDRVSRYLSNHTAINAQQAINSQIAMERLQAFRRAIAEPVKSH